MINIGQSIREELARQERTVSWLAKKLNCTRAVVYRIMAKNSIDTAMLARISVVLGSAKWWNGVPRGAFSPWDVSRQIHFCFV